MVIILRLRKIKVVFPYFDELVVISDSFRKVSCILRIDQQYDAPVAEKGTPYTPHPFAAYGASTPSMLKSWVRH